jgi:hypothetical protein
MSIVIVKEPQGDLHRVEWVGSDGYFRGRSFPSYRMAARFSKQLELHLLLDALVVAEPGEPRGG